MNFGYKSQTLETPTHSQENLEFVKNLKMFIVFNRNIWIFMHIYLAYSAESFTDNLFRKISVQEFRNQGVSGRTEFKTSRIVSIF